MGRRVNESSSLGRYLSELAKYSVLTKEREMEIARAVEQGGNGANLDELVQSNLGFVVKIAGEYRNMGLPFEDLLCEGNIGLIEAARRYDHTRGTRFISYAVWWIRKAILRAIANQTFMIRVPEYQMKKAKIIRDAEAGLSRALGRHPGREEISSNLGSTVSEIDKIMMYRRREVSLDETAGRDGISIIDALGDDKFGNPEEHLLRKERAQILMSAMRVLSDQERTVIMKRLGMLGGRAFILREIGESMGLTRERIRQIEVQAIKKLQRFIKRLQPPRAPASRRARGPLRTSPLSPSRRPRSSRVQGRRRSSLGSRKRVAKRGVRTRSPVPVESLLCGKSAQAAVPCRRITPA